MNLGDKIIVIVSDRLGDVVFCTPALKLLAEAKPGAEISVIALSQIAASILQNNPYVQHIHTHLSRSLLANLSETHDSLIDLYNNKHSRALTKKLNIKNTFVSPRTLDYKNEHQSVTATQFVQALLSTPSAETKKYQLFPTEDDVSRIKFLLDENQVDFDTEILVGCHIGCGRFKRGYKFWRRKVNCKKLWPVENFIALEKELKSANKKIRFVITGSGKESLLGKQFMKHSDNAINLMNKITPLQLRCLMDFLNTYITCDTGPMHIAASSNVPLIALFGPTNPSITGPFPVQDNQTIIRKNNVEDITITDVIQCIKHT